MNLLTFLTENRDVIAQSLAQHLQLVMASVGLGILLSIPLGILLTRHHRFAEPVLALAGIIQTIPGLVMLGFALILFGVGFAPALFVLTLYSILPILRNTYIGITQVPASYIDAARGIGMSSMQILFQVELPLALPTIISGIRISTVYIVSWATLAGMIGAGGLGDLIWTGLSTYNTNFILAGAIPSAILALLFSMAIDLAQRLLTPRGLRRKRI